MHDATAKTRLGPVVGKHGTLLAMLVMLAAQLASGQALPLQASDAQVTEAGNLEFFLTSSAGQPATAWSVMVVVADTNNTVLRQGAVTVDEYHADARGGIVSDDDTAPSLLRPQRTRRFEVTGPFDARLLLTVMPAAMVFLDGTSVGDRVLIDNIFQRRVEERDAKAEMLRQLLDVRTHYDGARALKEAIARLARSGAPDPGQARQLCQKNLREALGRLADGIDPNAELDRQIEIVRREYAAAVRHATAARRED